jgi:DNA-binding MarR family transcriptional regulator
LEIIVPISSTSVYSTEIVEILQRLNQLKSRFRLSLPENLSILRERLDGSNLSGKAGGKTDFDLFYNVGIILSRQSEPITMGELSHALDFPLSSATRIVDWLVKNDYAMRLDDPEDRRIVRVTLTEAGLEIYRTINEFFLQRIELLLRQFTPQEIEILRSVLSRIVDTIEIEM